MSLTLTPLEAILLGSLLATLGAVAVRLFMGAHFVSKSQCAKAHSLSEAADRKFKRDMGTLFRMVRALLVNSDIPRDQQERILNDRDAGGDS